MPGEPGRRPRLAADPLADLAQLPGVPSAVAAAMAAVDVVLRDRGLRTVSEAVRDRGAAASAEASAALTDDHDRWALGALRLATELPQLASLIRTAPAQALARAHLLAARGVVPEEKLGRMSGDLAAGNRMRAVSELLTQPTAAPAVVLGAVVHAEIAVVAPFGRGERAGGSSGRAPGADLRRSRSARRDRGGGRASRPAGLPGRTGPRTPRAACVASAAGSSGALRRSAAARSTHL